jgi:hypothetical protein
MNMVFFNDYDVGNGLGTNGRFSNVRITGAAPGGNRPPVLNNPGSQTTNQNASVALTVTATDPDVPDVLSFSSVNLPPGLVMSTSGQVTGTATTVGEFNVNVSVSDGNGGSDSKAFLWTVCDAVSGCGVLNFYETTTMPFAGQDQHGTTAVENGGATLLLSNNTWRSTVQTFNITPQTVVEFDFESTSQAERTGIGFAVNDTIEANRMFKVYGTQSVSWDIKTFHNYTGGVKHYTIPVGQYYTGTAMNMVFFNDYDVGNGLGTNGRFSNVRIINAPGN